MRNWIEVTAKTVDDAITEALIQLSTTRENVDIEVLEKTLIKLITHLPEETVFYPGHGPITTLKELIYYFM